MNLLVLPDAAQTPGQSATSAGGPMRWRGADPLVIVLPARGTSAHLSTVDEWSRSGLISEHTSSSEARWTPFVEEREDSGAATLELRRLTGFTWDQLARLFGVARRSLHFWASGKPLNATNEEQLYRTLFTIRTIDRGSAGQNRALLLREHEGKIPFDLLAAGGYDEIVELVGPGPGRRQPQLRPLSAEAQAARAPRPPDELTGALQDRVAEAPKRDE